MNHIYRVIFNQETGTFQAVSEIVRTSRKSHSSKGGHLPKILLTPLSVAVTLLSSQAFASPTGGQVTAGVANIAQTGNITNINQSSQNAAINWQSFNVGKNETVNFNQPNAQSVTLNRVIGNERSVIDGAMNANGKVFISNANGMLIGKDAKINVGSLVATTANISDDDLMNGRYQFTGEGAGSIENLGHISVPKGGVVALVAPIVKNGGTITAHEGNVLLASAESFSITLPDNANFAYTLDKGTLQGLVDNGGAILADAGRVVLTAKGVDTVKKSLIKHSGNIEANTVQNKNGVIELLGDLDNSALNVSGSLKAEAKESGDGGFIETSASQVRIEDSAEVSTLAENGETGTWLIDPNDIIIASGAGKKSDGVVYTQNEITATGKTIQDSLARTGIIIESTKGKSNGKGDVIIDDEISWNANPLKLVAQNDIYINKTLNGVGTASLALEYGQGTADGGESDYHIKNGARVNLPEGENFNTKKGGDGTTTQFQVIHNLPTKAGNYTLSHANIAIGKDINLSETATDKDFSGYDLENHNVRLHGLGHNLSNLTINASTDNVGLFKKLSQGGIRDVGLGNANIKNTGNYTGVLVGKIDSGATLKNISVTGFVDGQNYAGGVAGYAPNTNFESVKFVGEVTGNNFVGGLSGVTNNIEDGAFIGTISATGDNVGGLAGRAMGDINNSLAGTIIKGQPIEKTAIKITGKNNVGGLVGSTSDKAIRKSYATGSVNGQDNVGGLIGNDINSGTAAIISESYFVGDVQGQNNVGGLGGYDIDNIDNSYVSGNISGKNNVGGLVGDGLGYMNVNYSYFNGKINATGNKGNLFGKETYNYEYNHNYYNRELNEPIGKYGEGKTLAQMQQQSTYEGWDFENKWRIDNAKDTPRLREVVNIEEIGVSAGISNNQAYWNNIPNKPQKNESNDKENPKDTNKDLCSDKDLLCLDLKSELISAGASFSTAIIVDKMWTDVFGKIKTLKGFDEILKTNPNLTRQLKKDLIKMFKKELKNAPENIIKDAVINVFKNAFKELTKQFLIKSWNIQSDDFHGNTVVSMLSNASGEMVGLIAEGKIPSMNNIITSAVNTGVDTTKDAIKKEMLGIGDNGVATQLFGYTGWGSQELGQATEVVLDLTGEAAKSFFKSNLEYGFHSPYAYLNFKKEMLVQTTLISAQQVVRTSVLAWDILGQKAQNTEQNAEYLKNLSSSLHRASMLAQVGSKEKSQKLYNDINNIAKNNMYAENYGIQPEHILEMDKNLALAVHLQAIGDKRLLQGHILNMQKKYSDPKFIPYNKQVGYQSYMRGMFNVLGIYKTLGI